MTRHSFQLHNNHNNHHIYKKATWSKEKKSFDHHRDTIPMTSRSSSFLNQDASTTTTLSLNRRRGERKPVGGFVFKVSNLPYVVVPCLMVFIIGLMIGTHQIVVVSSQNDQSTTYANPVLRGVVKKDDPRRQQHDTLLKQRLDEAEQKIQLLERQKRNPIPNAIVHHIPQPPQPPPKPLAFAEYKDGQSSFEVTESMKRDSDELARTRRDAVKAAMEHAWSGYKTYAWGEDILLPLSKTGARKWGNIGTTLVDALDTLWIMNMKDEFYEARDWVKHNLTFDNTGPVSFFETTIRSLGGLLSAFDLSGDEAFLETANDLGRRLVRAFDSPNGFPYATTYLNETTESYNQKWAKNMSLLAEIGTMQLEFRYLAKVTGNDEYARKADEVHRKLYKIQPIDGLFPVFLDVNKPNVTNIPKRNKVVLGALSDSFYEYLLKVWLQSEKQEVYLRRMYDKAMDGVHEKLLQKSSPNGLTYVAELGANKKLLHRMEHLACFFPGLLALGAYTHPDGVQSEKAQRDLKTGKALAYTCYQMYAQSKIGLSPEFVRFKPSPPDRDFVTGINAAHYVLRPETIESFYVLYKLTGDPIYRDWGWDIFRSIDTHCRTEIAFGSVKNVQDGNITPYDEMESFFLAETLKYLYLLFDSDAEIDLLDKHVFNTEAHPLRMFHGLNQTLQKKESVL